MSVDRTRGILLQVAFKAAVETGTVEVAEVTQKTQEYFETLEFLYDKYEISMENSSPSNSGGNELPRVTIDGVVYADYRDAKADPNTNYTKNFPDFKTPDNKESQWIYTKDGELTDFGKRVAELGVLNAEKALV